jgi:hypothetical protein
LARGVLWSHAMAARMIDTDLYQTIPELLILIGLLLVLFGAEALGWRIGRSSRAEADEAARAQVGSLQAAVLGLLALLLGFTFSMAAERFDTRRKLVVEEANAIGTALLRASLIEPPESASLKVLLKHYIDVRIAYYDATNKAELLAAMDEGERTHAELWRFVVVAAHRDPSPTTALLVSGLNTVLDLHATRFAALSNHVPEAVMCMLLVVATLGAGITGYASGFANKHYRLPAAVVLLLIASVTLTIIDLDRPRRGMIRSGQTAMLELQRSVAQLPAAVP